MLTSDSREIPSIAEGASIAEAIKKMLENDSFVLQVINNAEEPVGWLHGLDILRTFVKEPGMNRIMESGIRVFIKPIAEDDYLEEEAGLSAICLWAEKREHNPPYFLTRKGKSGIFTTYGLLRVALEERDRERELRKESKVQLATLRHSQEELEMALGNLIVDPEVVARLKSIPEYRDEYDSATGKIKITGIIKEGVYRHVINILRLLTELFMKGLKAVDGISREILVQTSIYHDVGKVQPHLEVGDMVDPKEAFEPGQYHAFRSASLARKVYQLERSIVYLIQYHHHPDGELPSDFPRGLLPMHRLFRLLDGLSAGITRRGSRISLAVRGAIVQVREESAHPIYNRCLELDLHSGRVEVKPLEQRVETNY
ncbi:HD domain-containing protein [Neomoorella humiferrea]|uniref:HD domain protein n=1 Tax=Neomoorella humiferrea TaxID=676965 RepID=A0A2T0AXX9_9FIRM|nr:HD domain-containing protein [Moorella humiferrea]PRR75748.1 HD domain protein [Moorella humiferrea]